MAAERNVLAEEMLMKENYVGALGLLDEVVRVCIYIYQINT